MRIYNDVLEMVKEVERDLFEMGIRYQSKTVQDQHVEKDPRFQTIELFGYAYRLTGYENTFAATEYLKLNVDWINAEIQERLTGLEYPYPLNPGNAWEYNKDFWSQFIRNGTFSYSYAERWQEQIPYVINELKAKPTTRQATMTMYDRHQDMMNWGGRDRVPCSLTYQFIARDGTLNLIYNQRSCDFIKFFGSDVLITIELLKFIAEEVDMNVGHFIHFLGSLHAFAGDLEDRGIF